MTIRPWGTGSVTPHRGGFRARLPGQHGRRNLGTYATELEAHAVLAAAMESLAVAPMGAVTLGKYGAAWLPGRDVREGVRERDVARWRAYVHGSRIATMPLTEIERCDVETWLASLRGSRTAKLAAQTKQNALGLLRQALEAASVHGQPRYGMPNPAAGVTLGKRERARTKERWTWLRDHEVAAVLGTPSIPVRARLVFTIAIATGLRAGELWGLRWEDIDERRQVIHVRHSRAEAPKGGEPREVPLLGPARIAFSAWRDLEDRRSHLDLVFPAPHGGHHDEGYDCDWSSHAERVGLGRATFHDLRHTCASHLLMGTWAPWWVDAPLRMEQVQKWLGHRSITTTQRYAHLAPESIAALVQRDTSRDTIYSRSPELNRGPTVYECGGEGRDRQGNGLVSLGVSRVVSRLRAEAERTAAAIESGDPHATHRALDLVTAALDAADAIERDLGKVTALDQGTAKAVESRGAR